MTNLISIDQLEKISESDPIFKNGCILDTNILIAVSLPIDPMNEAAEAIIQRLVQLQIPLFSNVNIRSEFLEIQRRILIPECLLELYELNCTLDDFLAAKLKSIQTSYRKSLDNRKIYKFPDERIKEFRELLSARAIEENNGWIYFCQTFLAPQLSVVWDEIVTTCALQFIKIRDGEHHPLLIRRRSWSGVTSLMGNYGLSSADSMILNLLLSSTLNLVATADGDMQNMAAELGKNGKYVLRI